MSNYSDKETSATDGLPIEGYEFAGTYLTYRYTSSEVARTINGQVYEPISIERGAVKSGTQEDDNLDLQITMPVTTPLVLAYAFDVAPPTLTMTLYRYHLGTDPAVDFVILWKGPVTSFTISGEAATLRVPSVFSAFLGGTVPNRYFQSQCNHTLYDARCKINPASFKTTTTVVTLTDDTTLTVVDDGFVDGYLAAGEIIRNSTGERRSIVNNVANVITLAFPFHSIAAGDSVDLRAGCLHSADACKTKFNNIINFGGFPYIPADNPFRGII